MKGIAVTLAVVLVVVGLSGCIEDSIQSDEQTKQPTTPSTSSRFIGTWKQENITPACTFTFFNDGACSITVVYVFQSVSGSWRLRNNQLIIDYVASGTPFTAVYDYVFSNNYQSLYLYDVAYEFHYNLTKQ